MDWHFNSSIFWPVLVILLSIGYFYFKHSYSYWQRRGVQSLPVKIPFGNFQDIILQRSSVHMGLQKFYNSSSEPVIGVYALARPILILRDPEIIRCALIRDFQHFHDRGTYVNEKRDPLSASLFSLNGQRWRGLRSRMTPTFSSGKLKAMFGTLVDCGVSLQMFLAKLVSEDKLLDVRELSASYATNVIASVAFGADINCIDAPDTDFRRYGRKAFGKSFIRGFINLGRFTIPSIFNYLPIKVIPKDIDRFMTSLVKETLEYREKTGFVRKDLFQLLLQLRNTGQISRDDQWDTKISAAEGKTLTLQQITTEAFGFFLAGFETSSTTMSFCLHEIARSPEIQTKVHEEIDRVLAQHDGKITYESVSDMKYVERCIDGEFIGCATYISIQMIVRIVISDPCFLLYITETLRKYPPAPTLNRECTKEYTFPGTNITIEKGTPLLIPVYALQRDERFYPNPTEFRPERFSGANLSGTTFVDRPYLPFGEGPRSCIGLRMGKMQTITGVILMLQKHRYELLPEDLNKEIEMDTRRFLLAPRNDMKLLVRNR